MTNDPAHQLITNWHTRAQIDYHEAYIRLYIAYNAWFQQVTVAKNDRAAINALKKRFVIWADYQNGNTLHALRPLMAQIVETTQSNQQIKVKPVDENDWQSLIEYWYQVRCHLFHGAANTYDTSYYLHIELAYTSLNVFMTEIVTRMSHSFTPEDHKELQQITQLVELGANDTIALQRRLHQLQLKYIHSPDIWNVDMIKTIVTF